MASDDVTAAIEVERRVRKRYLGASETNLRPAVTEALRRLYSLPRLPANPFFFLATALSAHSSHGNNRSVWSVPDAEVMDDLEDVTLVDGGNGQTCKMNRFSDAWGLPHVLRACDREGLTDVKTLLRRFPPSLYPTPGREQDPRNPACMRQALLSLQEGCMHRRKYQGAPSRVGLRVDLVVDAPTIAEGLQTFVEHIYDATEGVAAHGEQNAVRGVLLMPGKANWSSESRSRRRAQWWGLDKMRRERRGFETAVKRATSSHHKVAMECIVQCAVPPAFLDGAYGTAARVMRDRGGGTLVSHFSVRTYYTFHYRVKTRKGTAPTATHYATLPFESMYTGLFLEQHASTAYNDMYGTAVAPTSPLVLKNNAERMMRIGARAMREDDFPRALRLAQLIFLLRGDLGWHDGDDPPEPGTDAELRERAFCDLIRMTNSSSVWLQNVATEARTLEACFNADGYALEKTPRNAEALAKHLQHLHFRLDDFMREATRRDFGLEPLKDVASEILVGAIRACERAGRALANPETSRRVSLACEHALEKAKLLASVVALTRQQEVFLMRPRLYLMQAGAFGINLVTQSETAADADAAAEAALEAAREKQRRRRRRRAKARAREAAGKGKPGGGSKSKKKSSGWFGGGGQSGANDDSSSDSEGGTGGGFAALFAAKQKEQKEETGGLQRLLGIPLVDARVASPGERDLDRVWQRVYEVVAPGTCVHFEAGERWMRRHRYCPPRHAHAAMLLQYVVDARLDECLETILTEAMEPPLVRNPFPSAVARLRGVGHQFDVSFHLSGGDIITGGEKEEAIDRTIDEDDENDAGRTNDAFARTNAARPSVVAKKTGAPLLTRAGKALRGIAAAKPRLTMVSDERSAPTPMYCARPPSGDPGGDRAACFGLYSAVALADPVRVRRLMDELPLLFASREWQDGPYQYQCIPALGGNAAFSAGLGVASGAASEGGRSSRGGKGKRSLGRSSRRKGGGGSSAGSSARDAVGFTPVVEECTRCEGPDKRRACDAYGADVVRRLLEMQEDTPWLVHDVTVPRGVLAAAGAAAARRQLEAEERAYAAGDADAIADLDDRPSTAAASELLSRMGSAAPSRGGKSAFSPGERANAARRGDAIRREDDAERRRRLDELKARLAEAEAALERDYAESAEVGGAIGQSTMREQDVIRIPHDEMRSNQRDVARIISRVAQQGGETCAQISVKFRGTYVPAFVNFYLLFQQRGGAGWRDRDEAQTKVRTEDDGRGVKGDAASDDEDGGFVSGGRSSGGRDPSHRKLWPLDAYTVVFGSRKDALAYAKWHDWRGDPSSGAASKAAAARFRAAEEVLTNDMDYLNALRCRAARALVSQESRGRVANLAATLMSVPTLTQSLQDQNSMLRHLVGLADAPEDLLIKLDMRSARHALLEYLDDAERVLTSPSLSYHLGANRVMVKNLAKIRSAEARAGGALEEDALELLREVNTWLAVSETSVARGLVNVVKEHDAIIADRNRWRAETRARRAEERERAKERLERTNRTTRE